MLSALSLGLLGFDVVIVLPVTGIIAAVIDVVDVGGAALVFTALWLARVLVWYPYLRWRLRPMSAWLQRGERSSDRELLAADETLASFVVPLVVIYSLTWFVYFIGSGLIGYLLVPDVLRVGAGELLSLGLISIAAAGGAPMIPYPLAELLATRERARLGRVLEQRALVPRRSPTPMLRRLGAMAAGLVIGPMLAMAGVAWNAQLDGLREAAVHEAHEHAFERIDALARGEPLEPGEQLVDAAQLPSELAGSSDRPTESFDLQNERAYVAWPLPDARWLLVERQVALGGKFWLGVGLTAAALALWATFVIVLMVASITGPIEHLRATVHRVIDVGDLSEIGRVPVLRDDELGQFTADFNVLLDELRRLAATTQRVAGGDLGVEITGRGELVEGFRGMVGQLHDIIVDIRGLAVGVVSAAHEIEAATREQELASIQQDQRLQSLRELMRSLADSAAQIDAAAHDVHGNAERTLATTDDMATQLRELDEHARGIAELLQAIREVADRSDLLALNGSLEATRAGEAGRGFALVAAEMRRLAERVTGTVADVQRLVGEMARASERTSGATTRSHSLAAATTASARGISDETRRQTSDTEHASTRVHEVAELASQTSTATVQTRSAAQDMRERAAELERTTTRFVLRDTPTSAGPAR